MNQQPKTNVLKTEPAVVVSTITAFLIAVMTGLAVFGIPMSDEQQKAVIATVAPTVGVVALIGPVIRQLVYSPESAQNIQNDAVATTQQGEVPTKLPV